jgi:hypothetical protein
MKGQGMQHVEETIRPGFGLSIIYTVRNGDVGLEAQWQIV